MVPPTITPDRALKALARQLDGLQKLRNREYAEAAADESEWTQMTQSIIEAAFGDPSPSLVRFYTAGNAGPHFPDGMSSQQYQQNFELRIRKYDALLRSLIGMFQLQLPEEEIKGVYEPGEQYAFYRDLSSLVATVTREIFIVDAYLDEELFNLYVDKVPAGAMVRILSNRIGPNVEKVARMYSSNRPLELRSSAAGHDRAVFLDQRGWVIGQSIKDAARKKPTYMIELDEPLLTAARDIYNGIWASAAVVI